VVGYAYTNGDAANHAFSWTQAGGMVDLDTLGVLGFSFATAVSNGQVVGYAYTSLGEHAFSWTQGRYGGLRHARRPRLALHHLRGCEENGVLGSQLDQLRAMRIHQNLPQRIRVVACPSPPSVRFLTRREGDRRARTRSSTTHHSASWNSILRVSLTRFEASNISSEIRLPSAS
jgi:probable HAF family extracellular repeat protein